jgi:hypothetical protein
MVSKKVQEALKNVTQARGYTAAEEATAKEMLAKIAKEPPPKEEIPKFWSGGYREAMEAAFQQDRELWRIKVKNVREEAAHKKRGQHK